MAQQRKTGKKKQAPKYSADAMALRLVLGLILIALGVLIFLAVALGMEGSVFEGTRLVAQGLAGSLAVALPVIPIWGGVLLIISTQRRAPLRALCLAAALFVLVATALTLLVRTGSNNVNMMLMDYLKESNAARYNPPDTYQLFLARGYELGRKGLGGGLLGMLLAWPLWKLVGAIPGMVVVALLALADMVFLFHVDVKKLAGQARNQASLRAQRKEQEQQELRQRELAWQQQTAAGYAPGMPGQQWNALPQGGYQPPMTQQEPMQDQPAYAQQTIWQQPQEAQTGWMRPVTPSQPGQAGFQAVQGEQYTPVTAADMVKEQADYTAALRQQEEAGAQKGRLSHIFGKKQEKKKQEPIPVGETWQNPAYTQPVLPVQPAHQAAEAWTQPDTYGTATWRGDEEAQTWQQPQARRKPTGQTARMHPVEDGGKAPITRKLHTMQQRQEIEPEAAPAPKAKQQPMPSWSETPPWEDAPAEATVVPKVQMDTPKDGWKPELKLPPRKQHPEEEQAEAAQEVPYVYPSMALLKTPEPPSTNGAEEDAVRSQRLEDTLKSFKIPAKVRHVTHGPAISRFELEIAAGIRVNKITELDRNIAMNMEVKSVRIEAPIPGKSLVGVEVPNRRVIPVTLREVLETPDMQAMKSSLGVALGKDIAGMPIVCDLARMPHLLIAGATGSGKSVCVNAMINSILFRSSPKEVRMILVDPMVVELQCYNGIPHLLIPVVSDPHKAAGALEWAVAEMMERYRRFTDKGVREITGYNAKLEDGEEYMPRIVIVIDELADLMMTCRKDVEDRICRLAQLARAAGIHLVVATQRPSVDVITGLIKANIPSRIAFKVSSFVDSRTILDRPGAEKLLGYGDMLYLPNGEFTPIRVQGCFLTDAEVNRITDFIRQNSQAEYDPGVMEQLESMQAAAEADGGVEVEEAASGADSLLQQAIEMTVQDGQTSTSMLQRRLRIGYARAGRLVDEMEKRGIVSQKDGAKPRMCLISREEFEHLKQTGALEE